MILSKVFLDIVFLSLQKSIYIREKTLFDIWCALLKPNPHRFPLIFPSVEAFVLPRIFYFASIRVLASIYFYWFFKSSRKYLLCLESNCAPHILASFGIGEFFLSFYAYRERNISTNFIPSTLRYLD